MHDKLNLRINTCVPLYNGILKISRKLTCHIIKTKIDIFQFSLAIWNNDFSDDSAIIQDPNSKASAVTFESIPVYK